ncbi:acyl-homoserine-lactone synthase [mine drainage metagenome]|uniref:Acyl-homoserine-lactone synthase n=1 Tax=mine drainage metagenome TaxID=410659 RepID=A0A1J5Q2F1_9ZZZZ
MENITFGLSDMHRYGAAYYDYLRLRKQFFVDTLGWNIPHDDTVEMDQYDNPLAHYSVVLRDGEVVGGARTMATTAAWGEHSYMLRDAFAGKLPDIPASVMPHEVQTSLVWECTRLVMSDAVKTQAERSQCLTLIVEGLAEVAMRHGASELMSLSPVSLMRALRQLGWQADRLGEPYENAGDGRRYAVLTMPVHRAMPHPAAMAAPPRASAGLQLAH